MTGDMMTLRTLLKKTSDADLLREIIGSSAELAPLESAGTGDTRELIREFATP